MLEAGIFLVVLVQIAILLYLVRGRAKSADSEATNLLKTDIDHLSDNVNKLREGLSDRLDDRLDKNQNMMLKSLQKQFQQSAKLISEVTTSLGEIKNSNKQVV